MRSLLSSPLFPAVVLVCLVVGALIGSRAFRQTRARVRERRFRDQQRREFWGYQ